MNDIEYSFDRQKALDEAFKIDKLERSELARNLEELIRFVHEGKDYKSGTDNNAFVIAVNASWGTGKTTFLEMFKNYLYACNYDIVEYNAWENDYWNDPFNALFDSLLESKNLKQAMLKTEARRMLGELPGLFAHMIELVGSTSVSLGEKSYGLTPAHENVAKLKKSLKSIFRDPEHGIRTEDFFQDYGNYKKAVLVLKELMEKAVEITEEWTNLPLVILIDEMDRCKPSFAVKTLEIIKHFFNIKGLVFLFAIDTQQLAHTVRKFYGNDFEANGYLGRFFDHVINMPEGDVNYFVREIISKDYDNLPYTSIEDSRLAEKIVKICDTFKLPPREIKKVLASYQRLSSVEESDCLNQCILYFYLTALKYQYPELLENALLEIKAEEGVGSSKALYDYLMEHQVPFEYSDKYSSSLYGSRIGAYNSFVGVLLSRKPIWQAESFSETDSALPFCYYVEDLDRIISNTKIIKYTNSMLHFEDARAKKYQIEIEHCLNLSFILYKKDFVQFSNISHRRPLEHLMRRLEMYDEIFHKGKS